MNGTGIGSFLNGTANVLNGFRRAAVYAVKHPGEVTVAALALTARVVNAQNLRGTGSSPALPNTNINPDSRYLATTGFNMDFSMNEVVSGLTNPVQLDNGDQVETVEVKVLSSSDEVAFVQIPEGLQLPEIDGVTATRIDTVPSTSSREHTKKTEKHLSVVTQIIN